MFSTPKTGYTICEAQCIIKILLFKNWYGFQGHIKLSMESFQVQGPVQQHRLYVHEADLVHTLVIIAR